MTIAMRHSPGLSAQALPAAGRVARTEIFATLEAAEPHWRALELGGALSTPYQRFDFLSLWQCHVGAPSGVEPFIAVGFDAAGAPLLLLPCGKRRFGALQVVEFLGGKHANFNFPLCRRDLAVNIGKSDIAALLSGLSGHADVLLLANQPVRWHGVHNPLALLAHQASPSFGYSGALAPDFDALLRERGNAATRKKLRKKAESLARHGSIRLTRADTLDTARVMLDAFFAQKRARMQGKGIANVFDEAPVRRMIEAGATEPGRNGQPVIELYALWLDDTIIATTGGIVGGGRFSAMFNSIILGQFASESPGEQMLLHLVRACCERGLTAFDLGTGEARYKNLFCNEVEPLFDSFIGLTPAGRIVARGARWSAAAKRTIKHNPTLWSLVNAVRRLRGRLVSA